MAEILVFPRNELIGQIWSTFWTESMTFIQKQRQLILHELKNCQIFAPFVLCKNG